MTSHYTWLETNLKQFLLTLNFYLKENSLPFIKDYDVESCGGLIGAHGDKCYILKGGTLPFEHLAAIYLLTHVYPFSNEVREVWINRALDEKKWVDPFDWVLANYTEGHKFINYLPRAYSK